MQALRWWMRIVGALYLMEGIGLALMAAFAADEFAAMWATATPGSLDAIAVRGTLVAGLPGVLTWVLFGALLWLFSRQLERARVLTLIVVAWELLVWLPLDLIAFMNGFAAERAASLIAVHLIIGVTGILALRQQASNA
jgi:uncharacterized membrane protein (GlpM family)